LESGTIIPLRVILVNSKEDRWEINYLDHSLLHLNQNWSSSVESESQESKLQEKQSVSSIFSKVSLKREDKIVLKHVKLSPVEIILPNYNKESMDIDNFDQDVFRVIVVVYEQNGNSYLRLIKVNSKTFDLIPINTFELSMTRVHDIFLSSCYNCSESDRKLLLFVCPSSTFRLTAITYCKIIYARLYARKKH
jgi:tRNA threonylcarbamoyladenosine modification (KEOPS) complex  Pcc1 subunit